MDQPLGVYISVPFCKAKCTFCNFASDAFAPSRMQAYVERLCHEIATARSATTPLQAIIPSQIDTLYFGGGTPSLLSAPQFRQIFAALRNQFTLTPNAEITLECAPGQLADETLEELLRQGINRISLGVQSFVDKESAAVGRLHTQQLCLDELKRLRIAGLHEINLDLIAGLPHQTAATWQHSLETLLATGVPHASVYLFELDEDSNLGREVLAHGSRYSASTLPTEDETTDWYQQACDLFTADGLHQYEISNFARPGHQSRHNLKYWRRHPYLGFGLDAHSMLATPTGAVRFANTDNLDQYSPATEPSTLPLFSQSSAPPEADHLDSTEAFEETLFLGLRLNEGLSLATLRDHFGEVRVNECTPALHEVHKAGLLDWSADRITLTPRGRVLSNEVFSRLLLTPA
jgi:oxygen-independent coproporphyrinogen III oxidase